MHCKVSRNAREIKKLSASSAAVGTRYMPECVCFDIYIVCMDITYQYVRHSHFILI